MKVAVPYCLFLLLLYFSSCSEDLYTQWTSQNQITLTQEDTIYTFFLLNQEDPVATQYSLYYNWFSKGSLGSAQGAYVGKLLHGEYLSMLRDNTLLEKGTYYHGLKDGIWCRWYDNGNMKSINHYHKGTLSGPFQEFNKNGLLIQKGSYKQGQLHGKLLHYDHAGELTEKRYKKGTLVEKDTSHWHLKDWFQRKTRDTIPDTTSPPLAEQAADTTRHQPFWKRLVRKKGKEPGMPTSEVLEEKSRKKKSKEDGKR